MHHEQVFEFGWRHLLVHALYQVLDSVHDVHFTVAVKVSQVVALTSVVPAIRVYCVPRGFRLVKVMKHNLGSPNQDLSVPVDTQGLVCVQIENLELQYSAHSYFCEWQWIAHTLDVPAMCRCHRHHATRLGHAATAIGYSCPPTVNEVLNVEDACELLGHDFRGGISADADGPHARHVELRHQWGLGHRRGVRGQQGKQVSPHLIPLNAGEQQVQLESWKEEYGGPLGEGHQAEEDARQVRAGNLTTEPPIRVARVAAISPHLDHLAHKVEVRGHHSLGQPRRPARVEHRQRRGPGVAAGQRGHVLPQSEAFFQKGVQGHVVLAVRKQENVLREKHDLSFSLEHRAYFFKQNTQQNVSHLYAPGGLPYLENFVQEPGFCDYERGLRIFELVK
ncbi:unnamed protein product [Ixodes pacificus]